MREVTKQAPKPSGLRATAIPVLLTNWQRKRLWWRAQRMAFSAAKTPGLLKMSRKEWTQLVYLILIRHPNDYLGR